MKLSPVEEVRILADLSNLRSCIGEALVRASTVHPPHIGHPCAACELAAVASDLRELVARVRGARGAFAEATQAEADAERGR